MAYYTEDARGEAEMSKRKHYYEKLPKNVFSGECMAFTGEGERCRRKTIREIIVYPSDELYDSRFWCRVRLCREHLEISGKD
jgi:hypothetical protein